MKPIYFFISLVIFAPACDRPKEAWVTRHREVHFRCADDTMLFTLGTDGCELGLSEIQLCAPDTNPDTRFGTYFYEGRDGGLGDTLQLIGCNESVWGLWRFGRLDTISVREPWMGMTDTGIMLGDSLEDFLEAYPDARHLVNVPLDSEQDDLEFWCTDNLIANFDSGGRLLMMEVYLYLFDEYQEGDEYYSSIGPYGDSRWE